MPRNYKQEYANYDGTEAVKKKRAQRNKARRKAVKAGYNVNGKDVDHKNGNPSYTLGGSMVFTLLGSNRWSASGMFAYPNGTISAAGHKQISDTLTKIRITTLVGTNTFDAGYVNILYE